MIPEILEDLIHQGRAQYKTWVHGGAAIMRIPVMKNTFSVVIGVTYHPFADIELPADVFAWNSSFIFQQVHELLIYNSKNAWMMNYRDWYTMQQDSVSADARMMTAPGKPRHTEVYLVSPEDIRINLRTFTANVPSAWAGFNFAPMPDGTDELSGPMYAGTPSTAGINTLQSFQFFANDTVHLPTNDQLQNTIAAGSVPHMNSQFQEKVFSMTPATAIGAGSQSGMNYPLLSFGLVEVYEPLPSLMNK